MGVFRFIEELRKRSDIPSGLTEVFAWSRYRIAIDDGLELIRK